MSEHVKKELRRIASYDANDIGHKEENVKNKIIVPILEHLGHARHDLDFEYGKGTEIDIFIKGLPRDCGVIIDTKSYDADLDLYLKQLENYARDVGAALAIIANGKEIRFYSPYMRGYKFEQSLLYSIKREELSSPASMKILEHLLLRENLLSGKVTSFINKREKEIKKKNLDIEKLKKHFDKKLKELHVEKARYEKIIKTLQQQITNLENRKHKEIQKIRESFGLPVRLISVPQEPSHVLVSIRLPEKLPSQVQETRIEDYLRDKNELSKELFGVLRERVLSLGSNINEFVSKGRTYYRSEAKQRTFLGLTVFKRKGKVHVLLTNAGDSFKDPKNIARRWGKSPHFYINSKEDIDYAMELISQAYER